MIQHGWPEERNNVETALKEFWLVRDSLTIHNGLILKGERIFVPSSMRKSMLERLHLPHLGMEATIKLARDTIYWPGINKEVRDKVGTCSVCLENSANQSKMPMISHEIPSHAFESIGMDNFEIDINGKTRKFLLTVCFYSDYFEVDEVPNLSATATIAACKKNFARHGIPATICTDNGTNFKSEEFAEFARSWEYIHVTSSPNHQQGNGKSEAAVKIAKTLLKKCHESGEDFEKALLIWRNTPNKMESSPAQRMFSRMTRSPIPITAEKLKPKIAEDVTKKIQIQRERIKSWYDKRTKPLPELSENQQVFVKKKPTDDKWQQGVIKSKIGERKYVVEVDGRPLVRNRTHIKASTRDRDFLNQNLEDDTEQDETTEEVTDPDDRGSGQSPMKSTQKSNILVRHNYIKQQETPVVPSTSGTTPNGRRNTTPDGDGGHNTTPDGRRNTTPDGRHKTTPDGRSNTTSDGRLSTIPNRPVRNILAPRRLWDYILK
jgi:Integrase zinc binding domain